MEGSSEQTDWELLFEPAPDCAALEQLAEDYVQGATPPTQAPHPFRKLGLPKYHFTRESFWIDPPIQRLPLKREANWLLGHRHASANGTVSWSQVIDVERWSWLADHQVNGVVTAPGALFVNSLLAAIGVPGAMQQVVFPAMLVVEDPDRPVEVQTVIDKRTSGEPNACVYSRRSEDEQWMLHAQGTIEPLETSPAVIEVPDLSLLKTDGNRVRVDDCYQSLREVGISLGPAFQGITSLWADGQQALAEIALPAFLQEEPQTSHPVLMDACFQVCAAAILGSNTTDAFVPFEIETIELWRMLPARMFCLVRLRRAYATVDQTIVADMILLDQNEQVIGQILGFTGKKVLAPTDRPSRVDDDAMIPFEDWFYRVEWQTTPRPVLPSCQRSSRIQIQAPLEGNVSAAAYCQFRDDLERRACIAIENAFVDLGWSPAPGAEVSPQDLLSRLKIQPRYERLYPRLLAALTQTGAIRLASGRIVVERPLVLTGADPDLDGSGENDDSFMAREAQFLSQCGRHLADVLSGKQKALPLLFPEDGVRADELYRNAPLLSMVNRAVADAVRDRLATQSSTEVLRILEIGAGTGGTTQSVLPVLVPERSEYVFTDVSPAFFASVEERFSEYRFVEYRTLDIEQDLEDQRFVAGQYDVVIAANVLHATQDLGRSLANARSLLKPGGILLLAEGVIPQFRADITFGLLDGWWRYDDQYRTDGPLLDSEEWSRVLHESGFGEVETVLPFAESEQALFIAGQSNGSDVATSVPRWLLITSDFSAAEILAAEIRHRVTESQVAIAEGEVFSLEEDELRLSEFDRWMGRQFGEDATTGFSGPVNVLYLFDARQSNAHQNLPDAAFKNSADAVGLLQRLSGSKFRKQYRVTFVTALGDTTGSSNGHELASSPIDGLAKTSAIEFPEWCCRVITVRSLSEQGHELADEICFPDDERRIHLVDQSRQTPRLVRASLDASASPTIRAHRTYLITGGTGGLGLETAKWLVDQGATHLALLARNNPGPEVLEVLQSLQDQGVEISLFEADVADSNQLNLVVGEIGKTMPPLAGVIHAAGLLRDAPLGSIDCDPLRTVFAAKVSGAWNLHQVTGSQALDFFVLYSSTASLLGNRGQAVHAAANAFLDQLARSRTDQGLAATSINWGPWSKVGAAAKHADTLTSELKELGGAWISPANGVQALAKILASAARQIAVLPMDWDRYQQRVGVASDPFLSELTTRTPSAIPSEEPPVAEPVPEAGIESTDVSVLVATEVQRLLRLKNPPPPKSGFFDLGMDSLMAVELRNRLNARLRLEPKLSSTSVFDHASVEKLALHLQQCLSQGSRPANNARRQASEDDPTRDDAIAIIGMACRFPGAENVEAYWQMLEQGRDAIGEIPVGRWGDQEKRLLISESIRQGGFLKDIDLFDAEFFGISRREAEQMDPQQRLVLEIAWEAFERAGVPAESLSGTATGVFIGASESDYGRDAIRPQSVDYYSGTGFSASFLAGRVSHIFGLEGPSQVVDTVCSSSLVALHQACRTLRSGECHLALAGGVHLMISPTGSIALERSGALAPDGRCKPFSAAANGFGRSEGIGLVVLKRLSDAQRDGDNVLAVVRGTAVNHDGASGGLTVPSGPAQEKVIRAALHDARLNPQQVHYLEAHGTGTSLGDPIEIHAAANVYGAGRQKGRPLIVGSAKSNIGHAEAAAGMAGIIKAILSMNADVIPRSLHVERLNPHVEWEALPVEVATARTFWPIGETKFASVSSFGLSGTNAHVILSSSPSQVEVPSEEHVADSWQMLPLSAKSEAGLRNLAERYHVWLQANASVPLANVCDTAARHRSHWKVRAAILASNQDQLLEALKRVSQGENLVDFSDAGSLKTDPLRTRANAYLQGGSIADLENSSGAPHRIVDLPTYPFQRERYWLQAPVVTAAIPAEESLLGRRVDVAGVAGDRFETVVSPQSPAWLSEHQLHGQPVFPASGFLEFMLSAAHPGVVGSVQFEQLLVIDQPVTIQTLLTSSPDQEIRIEIFGKPRGRDLWKRFASGTADASGAAAPSVVDIDAFRSTCPHEFDLQDFYGRLEHRGLNYGTAFRRISKIVIGEDRWLATLHSRRASDRPASLIDPCLLDAAFQTIQAGVFTQAEELFLPVSVDKLIFVRTVPDVVLCCGQVRADSPTQKTVDLMLVDEAGQLLLHIVGLALQRVDPQSLPRKRDPSEADQGGSPPHSGSLDFLRTLPVTIQRRRLADWISLEIQQVLKLSRPPGPLTGFSDLGMDSMVAVEFQQRLQEAIGPAFSLPSTLVLEYPTVTRLVEFLIDSVFAGSKKPGTTQPDLSSKDIAAELDQEIDDIMRNGM